MASQISSLSTSEGTKKRKRDNPSCLEEDEEIISSYPSSFSMPLWEYDVFLHFCKDTRRSFADHLYADLKRKGIVVFREEETLKRGKYISQALLKAIQKSHYAIVILSANYASSKWCLRELAEIVEWKKRMNLIKIIPIFYHVEPSDVRNQKGTFAKAFAAHEMDSKVDIKEIDTWRNAFKEVSSIAGYIVGDMYESEFIQSVVQGISRELINIFDDDEDKLLSDMAPTINTEKTPSPAPSSSSKHRWEYQVFLSFGGETRDIFTSRLRNELCKKFISTFKDDYRLDIGGPIKKDLLDAIEKSRMAVIIISKEYASSTRCLEELAKIVECMKDTEMKVLPVFYHVDPSDARKQEGSFRDAFAEHEKKIENKDKVQTWRNALKIVANLSGFHLKNGDELMFFKEIIKMISRELINLIDDHEDNLVGIDSRVNEMHLHLGIGFYDVRIIGICGMSGMGKTTLARGIFQKFNHLFRARSFLENVSLVSKRNGLVALQEKLLSDMKLKVDQEKWDVHKGIDVIRNRLLYTKVLIVLDDVDEKEQLETLAGNCNWFGPGSRIIVTTRDECLLTAHGVQIIHQIKGLHENEALQLFSQEAFRNPDQCEDQNFLDLCNDYVSCASGHPLALKVFGSSLLGKGREVWKSSLNRIQVLRNKDIQQKLKIGFDALGDTEKKMFLDIACFFNGEDKDRVVDLLEDSGCFPNIDIETLMDKSLITILGRKLQMHSVLQEMGREIVRCEYPKKLGKRSRLWLHDDILKVLRETSGTYKVQGIMLSNSSPRQEELNPAAFLNMKKLRLVKICDVNLPRGLNSLSNWLLLLEWHEYPLESMPESFQPSNLVELIMHRSSFEELPMAFLKLKKLKVMDFSGSEKLMMTPDFSGCPSLQKLIFEGCTKLSKVHPSIGALERLILLNLKDCKCLSSLLHEINLESLNLLILSGCSSFNKFPEIAQNMKLLSELYLDGTAIEELPLSIQRLTGLTLLNLGGCKKLSVFPRVICYLPALKTLILSGSTPTLLPNFFSRLTSLVALDLSDCNLLDGALPTDLSSLSSLESLNLSRNNFTRLPESISQLPKLKFLCLDNCSRLQLLPNLPSTTQFVMARECTSLQNYFNQVVGSTSGGGESTVINCHSLAGEEDILSEVASLYTHFKPLWMEEEIHQNDEYHGMPQTGIALPYDLSKDNSWRVIVLLLKTLLSTTQVNSPQTQNLGKCKKLLVFPRVICCIPALKILILSRCKGQPPSPDLFSIGAPLILSLPSFFSVFTSLVALDLGDSNLLDGALPEDLSSLSSLESLNLSRNNFTRLPDSISQLPKLKFLCLDNCSRLQLLPNLPSTTQFVMARECTSLQNYSNQVVVLPSGGGEFTVINCLSLAAREEDILSEVYSLYTHFQPLWMEEQIHQSEENHDMPQTAIPLPYDLSKDDSWRGIVLLLKTLVNTTLVNSPRTLSLGECRKLLVFPSVICGIPALKTLILGIPALKTLILSGPPSPVLFSISAPHTMLLPSLFSAMTFLVNLSLSFCNLLDGALPDDLSGLSSLEFLNLSGNNFTRLPVSISQLPKLKFLDLGSCVLVSTSAGGSVYDDTKLREASGIGSARKRKMEEAFGQREMAKVVRFDKHGLLTADLKRDLQF